MQEVKQKVSKYFFYLIAICYATEGIVDVVVGSAWPVIANSLKADISFIGILVMLYFLGFIVVSPRTYKIRHKIGTNYTMVLSQVCFSIALTLYIIASNIYVFALGMFINGIGCGLMEVNASSYVLKAYDVKEESVLYSFWGIGSVIGSTVMALAIKYYPPYQRGFNILICILIANIILLLLAKRSWTKQKKSLPVEITSVHSVSEEEKKTTVKITDLIKDKKNVLILMCFFLLQSVILTLNSLISTIAVNQGGMSDSVAVFVPIIYFASIFLGRAILGNLFIKKSIIKVLRTSSLVAVALLTLLSISPVNSFAICVIIILIGLITGPMIPFLNAYLKEIFDVTLLSALLGYGDVSGVTGIIILSGLTTFIMKVTSIQVVEIVFAVLLLILYILLSKTEKAGKQ